MISNFKELEKDIEGLSSDSVKFLEERGYEILKRLGEGNTRYVYLTRYSSGG